MSIIKSMCNIRNAVFYFVLVLILFLLLCARPTFGQTLSGSGTPADPYQIFDYDDLKEMRDDYDMDSGLYFELQNDIDATDAAAWYMHADVFKNHFNGNHFSIKHLNLKQNLSNTTNVEYAMFKGIYYSTVNTDTSASVFKNVVFDSTQVESYYKHGTAGGSYFLARAHLAVYMNVSSMDRWSGSDKSYVGVPVIDSIIFRNTDYGTGIEFEDYSQRTMFGTVCAYAVEVKGSRIHVEDTIKVKFTGISTLTDDIYHSAAVGGIFGKHYGLAEDTILVGSSFTGRILFEENPTTLGTESSIGGLVGLTKYGVKISDCFVEGGITITDYPGNGDANAYGGFIGKSLNGGDEPQIYRSHTGDWDITASTLDYSGSLIGESANYIVAKNVFSNTDSYATIVGIAPGTDFLTQTSTLYCSQQSGDIEILTATMGTQSTFTTASPAIGTCTNIPADGGLPYDFGNVWTMESNYPVLTSGILPITNNAPPNSIFVEEFEDGDITSPEWLKGNAYTFGDLVINSTTPIGGSYDMYGYANSSFSSETAYLNEFIPLTPGTGYTFQFDARFEGAAAGTMSVRLVTTLTGNTSIDGTDQILVPEGSTNNIYTIDFTTTATQCGIRVFFSGGSGARNFHIDNIYIFETAAPEGPRRRVFNILN